MAGSAVEMAVLDLELRRTGRTLSEGLSAPAGPVRVGTMLGIPATREIDQLVDEVGRAVSSDIARVRVKIEPGWDVEPVRALRSAFPDTVLQVDANGSYRLDEGGVADAVRLVTLDSLDIGCVEQPLPPADLSALKRLADMLETPICLDESLTSLGSLTRAIRYGACEVACVKPARLGGLFAARRAEQICADAGVPAFVGGLFETGLGRGANAALSGLAGFALPGDLTDPADYLDVDPFGYPLVEAGKVLPRTTPGVGPAPVDSVLSARTEDVLRWTP